ncbi:hypothetical protein NGRA_0439 [Nosema granulosis]|uniref:Uncharacterized protein n=1 Tax=Nosema granulosis TaxID=83296 RepID=A0A9P6L0J7_9MICR|nr:hypothetical protein NGRA_0439 [Nosema granulosis]
MGGVKKPFKPQSRIFFILIFIVFYYERCYASSNIPPPSYEVATGESLFPRLEEHNSNLDMEEPPLYETIVALEDFNDSESKCNKFSELLKDINNFKLEYILVLLKIVVSVIVVLVMSFISYSKEPYLTGIAIGGFLFASLFFSFSMFAICAAFFCFNK